MAADDRGGGCLAAPLTATERARLAALRALLDAAGARYAILEHEATVVSAAEGAARGFGPLAAMAPTFVLRSDRGWYAAIVSGGTRIAYRKLRKALALRDVSLADPHQVLEVAGAPPGTVSLVNPGLPTVVDARVAAMQTVFGGCGVPRHTLRIASADLIRVTQATVLEFAEPKAD